MKLRGKVLITLAFALISVLVMMLFFTLMIMQSGYADLEAEQMQHEAGQARAAIDAALLKLNAPLMDWAAWDDTYNFVTDPSDQSYISTNNISQTFTTFDINVLLIYDNEHRLLFGQGYNLTSGTFEDISPDLLGTIQATPGFMDVTEGGGGNTGVLVYGDQSVLLASQPVLTSAFLGPSPGVMMMGQYLDKVRVNRLAEQSGVPFTLVHDRSVDDPFSSSVQAAGAISNDGVVVCPLNSTQVTATSPLPDVAGTGSLQILVQEPRTIVQKGADSGVAFIMTTLLADFLFVGLSLGFVDRVILVRLNNLTSGVQAIKVEGGSARIHGVTGGDELANLSDAINGMLDELSLAHQLTRESEERYRVLAESAQDMIFIVGTDGRLTYANPTARAGFSANCGVCIGQRFTGGLSPEYASQADTTFQTVIETRIPHRIEVEVMVAGSVQCLDMAMIPLISPEGGFSGVMGIARDITDRKREEVLIRNTNAYNRAVIEISRDMLIIIDPAGIITDLNTTAELLLGYPRLALIGTRFAGHFTEPERVSDCCLEVLKSGVSKNAEVLIRHQDGHSIPLHCSSSLFCDSKGAVIGLLVAARDISEEKQVEEDRLSLARLEALGVLGGSLAHQFNNLHAGILGNLTLARSMLYDRDALLDRLVEAEEQLMRARRVTNKLLTFSRGGEPLKSCQAIEPLLREVVESSTGRGSHVIIYHVDEDLPLVSLDRDQIVEALQQMIMNAMEAMPGGGTITIAAELCSGTDTDEPQLCVSIIDSGQGISEENQKKIFDLNFTTKDGAAGLGLPLARSVIQKHGGDIEISSNPDGGTIVTFRIPIGVDRPMELAPRLPTGRTRVLIMDDEEAITEILRIWLTRRGYDPVITYDGDTAIQAYREAMVQHRPFDIVFLDLIVPGGMGGEETMRGLLTLDRAVRAIVCSGYSTDPVMASYWEFGFVGILPKPFQLTAMEALILKTLQGSGRIMTSEQMASVSSDQYE